MEDFSFMAIGTKVVAGSDDYSASNLMGPLIPEKFKKLILTTVRFEKFSGCGANCTILPGITLAQGSILCAGSLLNKDTKPWTIYAGNPARPISQRDKEKILAQAKYVREKEK
jgi:acetyltransferase-like isoleucine patch superfamily enzyme